MIQYIHSQFHFVLSAITNRYTVQRQTCIQYAKYKPYNAQTKEKKPKHIFVSMPLLMPLMREGLYFYTKSLEIYELIKRTGLLVLFLQSELQRLVKKTK